MNHDELKKGYVVKYKFIDDKQLKFAESRPLTKREMNVKLTELDEDKNVQEAVVTVVRYFDKG
jgi:hypothetical protein